MSIVFSCTSCGKKLQVQDGMAGRRAKCTGCQAIQLIPGASQTGLIPTATPKAAAPLPKADSARPQPESAATSAAVRRSASLLPPQVRKVLFFGLLGALGCLAGWLIGEIFLLVGLPTTKEAGGSLASRPVLPPLAKTSELPAPPLPEIPAGLSLARLPTLAALPPELPGKTTKTAAAPPPPPPEFAKRLQQAGAKSGDVQISLLWSNVNDLDLYCIEPGGDTIYYGRRFSRTGGELDIDRNAGFQFTNSPIENIYWPKGRAPQGKYQVYVHHYANHGGADPTAYKVNILAGGRRQEYEGEISSFQPKRLICEFEVQPAVPDAPELELAVSREVAIYQGGKNQLKLRLGRAKAAGPVTVRLNGDLRGLVTQEITIPANATEAVLDISAEEAAAVGLRPLTVLATADALQASAQFQLEVRARPPELRLAVSPEVVVHQGGRNRMLIRVARANLPGPIPCQLAGNLSGISPRVFTLGESDTEFPLDILAAADAQTGERDLKVLAQTGTVQVETPFRLKIQEIPSNLSLAVPPELAINQGGKNELPVRILRERFTGEVLVWLEGDLSGLTAPEAIIATDRDEGTLVLSTTDATVGTRDIRIIANGGGIRAEGTFKLVVAQPVEAAASTWSWRLIIVLGFWTALLALGLSLALVMGQNWYLSRPWLSRGQFVAVLLGSLVAGLIAGGAGQAFYNLLTQARLVAEIGFLAGWLLLGSLLGRGVVFFIPNLSPWRATAAGSCGGLLGAATFIAASNFGDVAGRFLGAAILGFAIGLMVALVETAFRKIWLAVEDGPNKVRTVNLGATPVVIGGDGAKCTVQVAGAPGKALKFWEKDGQVYCLDIVAEKTFPVAPGYRHRLKQSEVVVCSNR